jgi:hypothetical protein
MEPKTEKSFTDRYSLVFGAILTLIGVVETFVTPDPGSYFGPAMLVFGPSMLLLWWSGRTGNATLRTVANVVATIGVAIALFDIVTDFL